MPETGDEVVVPLPVELDDAGDPLEVQEAVIAVERLDGLRIDRLRLTRRAVASGSEEGRDE